MLWDDATQKCRKPYGVEKPVLNMNKKISRIEYLITNV